MKSMTAAWAVLAIGLLGVGSLAHAAKPPRLPGTLFVAVFDEDGSPVSAAHVYIYGKDKKHLIDGQDVEVSSSFNLISGKYRVYAAITKSANGYIDHFASNEATVRVSAGDSTSVILTLRRVH